MKVAGWVGQAGIQTALQSIDVRVPRTKFEVAWRVAFFIRFQEHIIWKKDQTAYASWEDLEKILEWEEVGTLQ